jgi:hypothetical protein
MTASVIDIISNLPLAIRTLEGGKFTPPGATSINVDLSPVSIRLLVNLMKISYKIKMTHMKHWVASWKVIHE